MFFSQGQRKSDVGAAETGMPYAWSRAYFSMSRYIFLASAGLVIMTLAILPIASLMTGSLTCPGFTVEPGVQSEPVNQEAMGVAPFRVIPSNCARLIMLLKAPASLISKTSSIPAFAHISFNIEYRSVSVESIRAVVLNPLGYPASFRSCFALSGL